MKPYPFQEQDIQALIDNGGVGIVPVEVGGGKTLIATETVTRMGAETVLVIAPKQTIKGTWVAFLERQYGIVARLVNSTKAGKQAYQDLIAGTPGWFVIGWEYWRRFDGADSWVLKGKKIDAVIADEVHRISNRKSKTHRLLVNWRPRIRLGLSGTPAGNKPENLWAVCRWVFPDETPRSFWEWVRDYMVTQYTPFSKNPEITREKNPGEFVSTLPLWRRHTKRGQCCEFHPEGMDAAFPEPRDITRTYTLNAAQRKAYKMMEDFSVAWLKDNPLVAEVPIVQRIRLRQITLGVPDIEFDEVTGEPIVTFEPDCESAVLKLMLEEVDEFPDDEKFLVFTAHASFIPSIMYRLEQAGHRAVEWHGGVSQKQREQHKEQFISDPQTRFLVASIAAIGEGTDGLQHAASTALWLSRSDNRMLNEQAKGRLARTGQSGQVLNIEFCAEDTLDLDIMGKQLMAQLELNASLRKKA